METRPTRSPSVDLSLLPAKGRKVWTRPRIEQQPIANLTMTGDHAPNDDIITSQS